MADFDVELKNVIKTFGAGDKLVRAVDNVTFGIERGEFFALLGPSGCGKTTTLRMIAGFERPTSGDIIIRGEAMQNIPPFHRPVNTVFQDYALFPHMSVIDNVMFGLRMDGVNNKEARKRAQEALELVQLPNVETRKPAQLSGGQQQRVALARALVKRPAVLLLDEPLGALDLKLRKQMQYELKSMQQQIGITFIFVTHDQEEAMTMADRIAVMSNGQALQVGTPRDIYEKPYTRFVADFIGETNFITGKLDGIVKHVGSVRLSDAVVIEANLPEHLNTSVGAVVSVPIRPERVGIIDGNSSDTHADATDLTILDGTVTDVQYIGTDTRYSVEIAGDNTVIARIQNSDYREQDRFDVNHRVKVFWSQRSTTVLDH